MSEIATATGVPALPADASPTATPTASTSPPSPPAPAAATTPIAGQKRSAPGSNGGAGFRAVKRRASKACQCCRARKVRCNVVEHGAPCTNCRLDEVECIVTESKRRKKNWGTKLEAVKRQQQEQDQKQQRTNMPAASGDSAHTHSPMSSDGHSDEGTHVPHLLYRSQNLRKASFSSSHGSGSVPSLSHSLSTTSSTTSTFPHRFSLAFPSFDLPPYIKPTPARISAEDLEYLWKKGALTLPEEPLKTALIDAHFKFVHPYMPLLDKRQFLDIVRTEDGSKGKVGLLLFQAVMFSGSAFVDMDVLRSAGYQTRKAARKNLFMKTRLLYDFDHEQDRMILVQALLLMSYWYETPDDQKDTWHWMGVAISLCHTIGLHRNPTESTMDEKRQKLWKRIWWSCYMRDRLVALGMRRPTRIKSEDCDVPMLTLEDFDIDTDYDENEAVFWSEKERMRVEREREKERLLAILCIEKARLCVSISHVLNAQYSVLNTNQGSLMADGSTRTTMMLLPKKLEPGSEEVRMCDEELERWVNQLPVEARYQPPTKANADDQMILHLNLLHLIYNTTLSALHRPQVLPSTPIYTPAQERTETQDASRRKVRQAASEITRMADDLIEYDLVRYLPTTGVTVILPAVIIHLLDIKSSNPVTRELSLEGFALCMQVLQRLRQTYSAADYATHFLEAAIKKAGIPTDSLRKHANRRRARYQQQQQLAQQQQQQQQQQRQAPQPPSFDINSCFSFATGAISIPATAPQSNAALTPPPDLETVDMLASPRVHTRIDETDLQLKLETFLQAPPSPQHDESMPIQLDSAPDLGGISLQGAEVPDFAMPDAPDAPDAGLEALMSSHDCDPFLSHDSIQMQQQDVSTKPFDVALSWNTREADDRMLDAVDLSFDDVIQMLETEIN